MASVSPLAKGGEYFEPSVFQEWKGHPVKAKSNKASHDLKNAERLWEVSEKLTEVNYDFYLRI